MSVMVLTKKENALMKCARMILADQCPPDRDYYLCMKSEDCAGACAQCWVDYLHAIGGGTAELPEVRRAAV